jgi:hypothetical protein
MDRRPDDLPFRPGSAGTIALIAGGVVLLCIPAIFYLESQSIREWPAHVTQLAATCVCVVSSAVLLLGRRGNRIPDTWRWLMFVAMIVGSLWILSWVLAFFFAIG